MIFRNIAVDGHESGLFVRRGLARNLKAFLDVSNSDKFIKIWRIGVVL